MNRLCIPVPGLPVRQVSQKSPRGKQWPDKTLKMKKSELKRIALPEINHSHLKLKTTIEESQFTQRVHHGDDSYLGRKKARGLRTCSSLKNPQSLQGLPEKELSSGRWLLFWGDKGPRMTSSCSWGEYDWKWSLGRSMSFPGSINSEN